MGSARAWVAAFWDEYVDAWLAGADPMPDPSPRWFASYAGTGLGQVTRDGFPEAYIGDLLGKETTPRLVILGLNPGQFFPHLQARDGLFADEIRRRGAYSAWARTGPYLRRPWTDVGPNVYFRSRVAFTRRWLEDPAATFEDMLIFEAYPWHSSRVTATIRPPADIVDQFVWQPIAELPTRDVFAFGRPWDHVIRSLGRPLVDALGAGGRDYGSHVASRAVRVYGLPSGQQLIVEWHAGSAGPPSEQEAVILKRALS